MKRAIVSIVLLSIVGIIIFFLVRPSENVRILNEPFGYMYEDKEGFFILRIDSDKENVEGQMTYYRLIEEYQTEPEIYKEYVRIKGGWTENELALTFQTSDKEEEPDNADAWQVDESLFIREEGETEIRVFKPISEKEHNRQLDVLKQKQKERLADYQKEMEEEKKQLHEEMGNVYGYFYEPKDDYDKWLLVRFHEQDKEGNWTGYIFAFDSPFLPNGGKSSGVTYPFTAKIHDKNDDYQWAFDLTVETKKEERTLKGHMEEDASAIEMNFITSSEKMTFEEISETQWENAYFNERMYRLSDLY